MELALRPLVFSERQTLGDLTCVMPDLIALVGCQCIEVIQSPHKFNVAEARLAQLIRAKRGQIKKTEPIRCMVDATNDPLEVSLDENVTRTQMHPA